MAGGATGNFEHPSEKRCPRSSAPA